MDDNKPKTYKFKLSPHIKKQMAEDAKIIINQRLKEIKNPPWGKLMREHLRNELDNENST